MDKREINNKVLQRFSHKVEFDSITDNELNKVAREIQKIVLLESESIIRKTLSGLLT